MRKLVFPLLALALLLGAALLAPGAPATATSAVRIQDDANILSAADRQNITAAAQRAPFAVTVWTNSTYTDKTAFYNAVRALAGTDTVALGVDPVHLYSHVTANGTNLTAANVTQADSAANARFGNKQWGQGFVDAINTLAGSAPAGGAANTTNNNPQPAGTTGGGFNLGGCGLGLCLIPILLIGLVAFLFMRNRGRGQQVGPAPVSPIGYGGPAPGGYNPPQQGGGYYPPQQGGGYYPPNQGSGIGGNIASGAAGALGGGLIGYEIGRNQNQGQNPGAGYNPGGGGGGGGVVDSAPGGSGADFGGGGGGGADFGGGGGGTFDSGGGGGADFGGGGSTV